ncbi:MAG TPA: glycoside hydrolase family 15 protein, partial [Dinghuibacter sp.]|uniref:glycoside hydrolase family 15 protein n=1 Tax=Dinghuibacter sp. TaxID=2024697 RepID=UPI002BCC6066
MPGKPPYRVNVPLSGLGSALTPSSKVLFTLSRGIVSEVSYPDAGHPCLHNLEWIVTDGAAFFSEEKRHTLQDQSTLEEGVPAYRLTNTCLENRYRLTKEVVTDPLRDVLLQKSRFAPLNGSPYRLFLLLSPFIGGDSALHSARVSVFKGMPLLLVQKSGVTIALLCSHPFATASVGYAGISDGWLDLAAHRRLSRAYKRADAGHVALTAEIDLAVAPGSGPGQPGSPGLESEIVIALGFGATEREAASKAWASLLDGFDAARERYMAAWRAWQHTLSPVAPGMFGGAHVKTSAMVLRSVESKSYPGALVSREGVRPRDLAAAFDAYQALGARDDAQRLLSWLMAAQEENGFWPRLLHPDGTPAAAQVARDQVAQVILMVDTCRRTFQLSPARMQRYWPLVWTAATYLVAGGPEPAADRWDEANAFSLHTLCVTVAALLAAADMADERGQPGVATYCRKTADYYQDHIDDWMYVRVGPGRGQERIAGYYTASGTPGSKPSGPATPDVLSLVRYGLRKPDDPRVTDTLRVVDADLRLDSPLGPCWQRRSGDDNATLLLTAERALYELSAGNKTHAAALLKSLEAYAPFGLFPERTECGHPWSPQGGP